jgi:hypothetical protein
MIDKKFIFESDDLAPPSSECVAEIEVTINISSYDGYDYDFNIESLKSKDIHSVSLRDFSGKELRKLIDQACDLAIEYRQEAYIKYLESKDDRLMDEAMDEIE